jgi:predicted nucleotidyltransferase
MNGKIKEALNRLKEKVVEHFGTETEIFLFGSAARGEYDEFSDVDVLVLIPGEVDIALEERIFDLAFEVGLQYDVVFGVIVYSIDFWKTPRAAVMPLYENIKREGISI